MKRMWLNEFKIAIISKDIQKIDSLISSMPQFKEIREMEETFYLFRQADELLNTLKNETAISMKKIRDTISFVESTQTPGSFRLNILQ